MRTLKKSSVTRTSSAIPWKPGIWDQNNNSQVWSNNLLDLEYSPKPQWYNPLSHTKSSTKRYHCWSKKMLQKDLCRYQYHLH